MITSREIEEEKMSENNKSPEIQEIVEKEKVSENDKSPEKQKKETERRTQNTHKVFRIRNQTPKRLKIEFRKKDELQIRAFAPLAERDFTITSDQEIKAIEELELRQLVSQRELSKAEKWNWEGIGSAIFVLLVVYLSLGGTIIQELEETIPSISVIVWVVAPVLLLLLVVVALLMLGQRWIMVQRMFMQVFTLLMVLVTGVGLTAAIIYHFGDGKSLLEGKPTLALLGRCLQFAFITIASLFPTILYFLFDRNRLSTLIDHFEMHIFRLDPTVKTLSDVYAKYGSQLDELYGRDSAAAKGRLVRGTRWPIWVCTLVLTIAWMLILLPVGQVATDTTDLLTFLLPARSGIVFGLLGAYLFTVISVSRRYTRGDLRPKAYSHIVARILIVVIMAWVVNTMFGTNPTTLALTFLIGVVPDTFWTVFNEFVGNKLSRFVHSLEVKHPLTDLEGIDLYDRARLAEEGITNVESLAHHDLIDLVLATRIPIPRLVDWMDQAILYLHLSECEDPSLSHDTETLSDETGSSPSSIQNRTAKPLPLRQLFKIYGIRTATDFISAYDAAVKREKLKSFFRILDEQSDSVTEEKASRIQVLYDTLRDDEWLTYIRKWREEVTIEEETIIVGDDGQLTLSMGLIAP
jgi:hypothetical protein